MLAGKGRRVFRSSAEMEVNHFPLSWSRRVSMFAHVHLGGVGMMLLGVAASPGAVYYQELSGKMLVVDVAETLLTAVPKVMIWVLQRLLGITWSRRSPVAFHWCCLQLHEATHAWGYGPIPGVVR